MHRGYMAVLAAGVLVASGPSASAEWENLQARMALVSDAALNPGPVPGLAPMAATATTDCDIEPNEVAQFDALLSLSPAEQDASIGLHARWGLPGPASPIPDEQFVLHREYVLNYNGDLKIPLYATYVLKASDVVPRTRLKCFREDPRLAAAARSVLADYVEPIFDRGHLVPRADMNRSKAVMINTFVLSNMMPQHDQFNQGIWETLESAVRAWALEKGTIVVVSGAVFDADGNGSRDPASAAERVKPTDKVAIPTHFYKIVLHERPNGFIDSIAILLPHTDDEVPTSLSQPEKLAYLQDHIVSIDQVEAVTSYDFFPEMPAIKQKAVERSVAAGLWD
jgi:endonuclease G, mitochondrial